MRGVARRAAGGRIACGAGTDQLSGAATLDEVRAAYEEQLAFTDYLGARVNFTKTAPGGDVSAQGVPAAYW